MPRRRRKDRAGREAAAFSDDESDVPDTASVISSMSDGASVNGEAVNGDEVEEISAQENFEDKVKTVLEGLSQKSAKSRTDSLISLRGALSKKYFYEFIMDRKITILDGLERCLKRGKGEEQAEAAVAVVLLCVQLGGGDESEEIFRQLCPLMTTIITDTSASLKARTSCATALGLMTFIGSQDVTESAEVLHSLEKIFGGSYHKGDHTAPTHGPEVCALHNAALISWCILLSVAPPSIVNSVIQSQLQKLPQLLESQDVDLRISAGEAIALLYELAREERGSFRGPASALLCEKLRELATDGNRHRAKKDRKQQRSSFRDILRTIEEGDAPFSQVRCGIENVEIDSWSKKRQYDSLCQVLGTGMNTHLMENTLIRDIFGLGEAPLLQTATKASKIERTLYNAAAFKARTKIRSKNRDKRAVSNMYS